MRIIGPVIGFARLIRRARRALALPFAVLVLAPPIPVNAQVPDRIPRLCFVTFDARNRNERFKPFFERLHDLGYVDGQTIKIDYLSADGEADRFASLADQCLQLKANIIVVTTTPAAQAVKNATHKVPIVIFPLGDPVGTGLVASLARPGGNVTGLSFMADGIAAKRLELLKEAVTNIAWIAQSSSSSVPFNPLCPIRSGETGGASPRDQGVRTRFQGKRRSETPFVD